MSSRKQAQPNCILPVLDVFILLFIIFLMKSRVIQNRCFALPISNEQQNISRPVSLEMLTVPNSALQTPSFKIVDSGNNAPPQKQSVINWLNSVCGKVERKVEVTVICPGKSSHVACQRGVGYLMEGAGNCRYKY